MEPLNLVNCTVVMSDGNSPTATYRDILKEVNSVVPSIYEIFLLDEISDLTESDAVELYNVCLHYPSDKILICQIGEKCCRTAVHSFPVEEKLSSIAALLRVINFKEISGNFDTPGKRQFIYSNYEGSKLYFALIVKQNGIFLADLLLDDAYMELFIQQLAVVPAVRKKLVSRLEKTCDQVGGGMCG